MNELRKLVDKEHELSLRRQCELFEIHRSGLYYKPRGEKPENLEIMRLMDEHYLKHPTEGVLNVQDMLSDRGFVVNHKRVRRLLRLMGLMAILSEEESEQAWSKEIHPSLSLKWIEY